MTKKPYKLDRVAIRMVKERPLLSDVPVNTPDSVVKLIQELLKDYDREIFAIVNFQSNLQPINMNIVSVGALNASLVHPREMLKSVVLSNASAVMMIHNHPGGTMRPSNEDITAGKLSLPVILAKVVLSKLSSERLTVPTPTSLKRGRYGSSKVPLLVMHMSRSGNSRRKATRNASHPLRAKGSPPVRRTRRIPNLVAMRTMRNISS